MEILSFKFLSRPVGKAQPRSVMALAGIAGVMALAGGLTWLTRGSADAIPVSSATVAPRVIAVRASISRGNRAVREVRQTSTPSALPESCTVLLERSIFALRRNLVEAPHEEKNPAGALQLRGVMQEGSRFAAFIEDTVAGKILQLRVGDRVGRARIDDINLQSVVYDAGGDRKRIEVGEGINTDLGPTTAPVVRTVARTE